MASTYTSDFDIIRLHQNDTLPRMELVIRHQFPGIELISPTYYSNGVCYLSPDQKVIAGFTARASLSINFALDGSIGVFMYRLQRKNTDQPDEEIISIEDETKYIQFVVVWKTYTPGDFWVALDLIEHVVIVFGMRIS
jgi:hypothetical protein